MVGTALPAALGIGVFVVAYLLQWVWNITCPELFQLPALTYWQAFRLIVIAGILFGAWRLA